MASTDRSKILNDIRYFESATLPLRDASNPGYLGKLFKQPAAAVAFGQLIGDKCREARIATAGASALYLLFTPALSSGQMMQLDYKPSVWQKYVAYGLDTCFNELAFREQELTVYSATFEALRLVAPTFETAIAHLEMEHAQRGDLLRVRCIDKTVRGYRLVVSFEVRPRTHPSHLWLEVTNMRDNRHTQLPIVALRDWDDARFLAGRITASTAEVTIHPRATDKAKLFTRGYQTPFRFKLQDLFGSAGEWSHPPWGREDAFGRAGP